MAGLEFGVLPPSQSLFSRFSSADTALTCVELFLCKWSKWDDGEVTLDQDLRVTTVVPGTQAARAGFFVNLRVIGVEGIQVSNRQELDEAFLGGSFKSKITVSVVQDLHVGVVHRVLKGKTYIRLRAPILSRSGKLPGSRVGKLAFYNGEVVIPKNEPLFPLGTQVEFGVKLEMRDFVVASAKDIKRLEQGHSSLKRLVIAALREQEEKVGGPLNVFSQLPKNQKICLACLAEVCFDETTREARLSGLRACRGTCQNADSPPAQLAVADIPEKYRMKPPGLRLVDEARLWILNDQLGRSSVRSPLGAQETPLPPLQVVAAWQLDNPPLELLFCATERNLRIDYGAVDIYYTAYHGTKERNVVSIAKKGFLTQCREQQDQGDGEYFSTDPYYVEEYMDGGRFMLMCELLLGKEGTHHTAETQNVLLVHQSENAVLALPRYVLQVKTTTDPDDDQRATDHELEQLRPLSEQVSQRREDAALHQRGGKGPCCAYLRCTVAEPETKYLWLGWITGSVKPDKKCEDVVKDFLKGYEVEEVTPDYNSTRLGAHVKLREPMRLLQLAALNAQFWSWDEGGPGSNMTLITIDDAQPKNCARQPQWCPREKGEQKFCRGKDLGEEADWKEQCAFKHELSQSMQSGESEPIPQAKMDDLQREGKHLGWKATCVSRAGTKRWHELYRDRCWYTSRVRGPVVERELWCADSCALPSTASERNFLGCGIYLFDSPAGAMTWVGLQENHAKDVVLLCCRVNLGNPFLINSNLSPDGELRHLRKCEDPTKDLLDTTVQRWDGAFYTSFYSRGIEDAIEGRGFGQNFYVVFHPHHVLPLYTIRREPDTAQGPPTRHHMERFPRKEPPEGVKSADESSEEHVSCEEVDSSSDLPDFDETIARHRSSRGRSPETASLLKPKPHIPRCRGKKERGASETSWP